MTVEVYDRSIEKIRIMYASKAAAFIKHNGIKTDDKGNIVSGRYAEVSQLDIEGSGIKSIEVIDELNRNKVTVREFGKKEPVKKAKEDAKEKVQEEVQNEKVQDKEESVITEDVATEPVKTETITETKT